MKKIVYLTILSLLISCKPDSLITKESVENVLIDGNWSVSNFEYSSQNKTIEFANCIFYFGEDGKLRVEKDTTLSVGTWSVSDSDPSENVIDDLSFNIVLYGDTLSQLTSKWKIINYNSKDLSLINNGSNILKFTKNK